MEVLSLAINPEKPRHFCGADPQVCGRPPADLLRPEKPTPRQRAKQQVVCGLAALLGRPQRTMVCPTAKSARRAKKVGDSNRALEPATSVTFQNSCARVAEA